MLLKQENMAVGLSLDLNLSQGANTWCGVCHYTFTSFCRLPV